MVLEIDDKVFIDVDKVSYINLEQGMIVVDGQGITFPVNNDSIKVITKAFKWVHASRLYNKDLKKGE